MRERELAGLALFRRNAEQELARRYSLRNINETCHDEFCKSSEEHRRNIYELEISQIMLEMQNRELQHALEKAATATAMYENSPAGYYTLDREGTILELNFKGALMLGKDREQLPGLNFKQFIIKEKQAVWCDFLNEIFNSDEPHTCDITLSVEGQSTKHAHFEGFTSKNTNQCLLTAIDTTEQKQIEEAIHLSELRLKRAELVSKTGNWELDLDTKKFFVSEGACKIYGVDKDELTVEKIQSIPLPEYRAHLDQIMQQLIEGNGCYDVEFKIQAQDTGEVKEIHSIATFDPEKRIIFGVIQDITQQKILEKPIHDSEQYYRSMVETSPDAIVILDTIGLIQFASHKAYEVFHIPAGFPIIGSPIINWVVPEMREFTVNRFKNIITGTIDSEPFEYKVIREDSTAIWTEIHGSRLYDTMGQVKGMFLICRDITERRHIEEEMRESEIFFKQSQRAASIGSYKLDIVTGSWKSSEVLDQILGITRDTEKSFHNWMEIVHPDDREAVNSYFQEDILLKDVVLKHNSFNKDYRIIRKSDGAVRWVHGHGELDINENGEVVGLIGTLQDITERKQAEEECRDSEERFRMVFENVFDGIALYEENDDPFKRRLVECNRQYAMMAGRSREELLGMGYVHHLQISRENNNNSTRLESLSLQKAYKGSSSWIRPDGKENVIEYIGVPIKWRGKSYSIGIDRDITDRIMIEADLIAAKEKAEESDRLKSAFLANMSHEIRTPLNSIIGFSEIMLDSDFEMDQLPQFASIIKESGNNLLSIISDIMDISKIEAGLVVVRKQEFSVNRLIQNLHTEYSFQAIKKGIDLRLDPSIPEEDIFICSDEIKLRQIMVNLLGNAIKFTENGFVEVSIKNTGDFLQFHVKDTGIGIPAEFQQQIFERFHQVESSLSRRYGGNGLGLAISKSLSELLGGKLWLESEKGKGSTFYFNIPIEY